jgi:hypothetical protein
VRNRPFLPSDNLGRPCSCLECQAAEITDQPIVRVPPDEFFSRSRWLHGEELKRWYAAKAEVRSRFDTLQQKLAMPPGEKL